MKNFWRKTGEETDYLGINAVYLVPEEGGGMYPFELQFHTHQSIDTKMQKPKSTKEIKNYWPAGWLPAQATIFKDSGCP